MLFILQTYDVHCSFANQPIVECLWGFLFEIYYIVNQPFVDMYWNISIIAMPQCVFLFTYQQIVTMAFAIQTCNSEY